MQVVAAGCKLDLNSLGRPVTLSQSNLSLERGGGGRRASESIGETACLHCRIGNGLGVGGGTIEEASRSLVLRKRESNSCPPWSICCNEKIAGKPLVVESFFLKETLWSLYSATSKKCWNMDIISAWSSNSATFDCGISLHSQLLCGRGQ